MLKLMRAGSHQESARWRMTTTSHLRQAKAGTPMSGLGDCALASGDSTLTSRLGVFAGEGRHAHVGTQRHCALVDISMLTSGVSGRTLMPKVRFSKYIL